MAAPWMRPVMLPGTLVLLAQARARYLSTGLDLVLQDALTAFRGLPVDLRQELLLTYCWSASSSAGGEKVQLNAVCWALAREARTGTFSATQAIAAALAWYFGIGDLKDVAAVAA